MITKKQYKAMFEKTSEKLKEEIDDNNELIQRFTNLVNDYSKTIENLKKTIEKNAKEIESLNKEIDIYKKYYNTDREPTEEEQVKILMNLRIHDLEREVSELKSELSQTRLSLNTEMSKKQCYLPSFYVQPYRSLLY